MKHLLTVLILGVVLFSCTQTPKTETAPAATVAGDGIDRTALPVKAPLNPTFKQLDVRNAKMPERFEVKAPEGAPNVILVLVDDLGFAGTSIFGGPVSTPTFDRICSEGV